MKYARQNRFFVNVNVITKNFKTNLIHKVSH